MQIYRGDVMGLGRGGTPPAFARVYATTADFTAFALRAKAVKSAVNKMQSLRD